MKALLTSLNSGQPIDAELGEVIESAVSRLRAGQRVDIEVLATAHPEYAEQLRELLPMAAAMVGLGAATESLEPLASSGSSRPKGVQAELLHRQLGDFRIIRELGHGGMGAVYEAEQLSMGRRVALKVLPFAALVHDKALQRFRNEVRAAAALDHPHIVSVYSIGEDRGVHFFAMQLVRGRTLADLIEELRSGRKNHSPGARPKREGETGEAQTIESAESPRPGTQHVEQALVSTVTESRRGAEDYRVAARLGVQAAEALQHAHEEGVLHRDIKPSNLLLDSEGKLYVSDFGLARIEADAGITMTGDLIGTLRYMAPEQALAKRVVIDHRVDIYSLGATLYELLTLHPTFGETDRSELLKQIAFAEPRALRKLDRSIPAELETIVRKSIAKNPDERYQTAQQLSDDLRAYLEYRPIKAKPPTLLNRAGKWSRRHVAVVWAAAVVLLLSTVVLMVASLRVAKWYHEAEQQRKVADDQLNEAQKQEQKATVVSKLLLEMLGSANPDSVKTAGYTVRELLDDFSKRLGNQLTYQPEIEATLRATIGNAYYRLGFVDKAAPHLTAALELRRRVFGPDHLNVADSLLDLAWNLRESGQNGEGRKNAEMALAIYRKNGSPLEPTVRALWTLQKCCEPEFEEGDAAAKEALVIVGDLNTVQIPAVANILHALSDSKLKQAKYREAELIARQAVDLHRRLHGWKHPETAWSLVSLGNALNANHKLAEAESTYREARDIFHEYYDSGHKSIRQVDEFLIAVLKAEGGKQDEARVIGQELIEHHRELMRRNPGDRKINVGLANLVRQYGQLDEAIELCRKAISLDSEDTSAYDQLGRAYRDKGQSDEAIAAFRQATKIDPKSPYTFFELGLLCYKKGNYAEAARAYRETFALKPKFAGVAFKLACAQAHAGQLDVAKPALKYYKRWIRQDEAEDVAWLLATNPDEKLRDGKLAVEYAIRACELGKYESHVDIDILAAAYAEAGDFESAIKWSEKALAVSNETFDIASLRKHLECFKGRKAWRE